MKKMIVFFAAGMALGLGFMPLDVRGIEANEYNKGKDLYENKCQMCHGLKGDGNGPAAAGFHPKPANFTDSKFWKQKNINKIITDTIEHGHGSMPPVGLSPDQIKAVIDYISHRFRPRR
jgi:mono/diheme cytochrome c family protein